MKDARLTEEERARKFNDIINRAKTRRNEIGEEIEDENLRKELKASFYKMQTRREQATIARERLNKYWYADLTEEDCEELVEHEYESTWTAFCFFVSLLFMVLSMFLLTGHVIIKVLLFWSHEESEVSDLFYGNDNFGRTILDTQKHILNLLFSQLPFIGVLAFVVFHMFTIVQEKTNDLFFLVGTDFQMLAVTKLLTIASVINLGLVSAATYVPHWLQLEPDDGT